VRSCFKSIYRDLNLDKRKGEEGGLNLRALMVVKGGEEGTKLLVQGGTTLYHKGNHLPSRFPSSKKRITLRSTLNGRKKVDQIFNIHLVSDQEQLDLIVLEFEDYAMTWWHQLCMDILTKSHLWHLCG